MSRARGITMLFASGAMVAGFGLAGAPAALADGPDTPPEVVAAIEASAWPELTEGQETWEVSVVEFLLEGHGYGLLLDGEFGPATRTAVVDFQTGAEIDADGEVGPITFQALLTPDDVSAR